MNHNVTIKCLDGKFEFKLRILLLVSDYFKYLIDFNLYSKSGILKEIIINYPKEIIKLLFERFIKIGCKLDDLSLIDTILIFDFLDEYQINLGLFTKGLTKNQFGYSGLIAELQNIFLDKIKYIKIDEKDRIINYLKLDLIYKPLYDILDRSIYLIIESNRLNYDNNNPTKQIDIIPGIGYYSFTYFDNNNIMMFDTFYY